MFEFGNSPPPTNPDMLLRRFCTHSIPALIKLKQERDPHKLFQLFKANAQNRLVVENRFAFEDTVSRLAAARRFDYIEQLLEQHKALPQGRREGFMVRIITLYGNAGMLDHALHTFYNLHLFGCPRTVKSFNAALKVLTLAPDFNAIHSFLDHSSQSFSISMDIFSLNILVKAFCDMGLLHSAYLLTTHLGITPDVVTYTTLISSSYQRNSPQIANGLWNLMLLRGCYPNLTTFNVRIQFLVNKRRAWQANSLLATMPLVKIKPDEVTFNLVIKGFFQAGYAEMAQKVYSSFHAQGYKPNSKIYQTMIHYLCKKLKFDLAYTISKDSMTNTWFPSFHTICMLLEGLSRKSKKGKVKVIMTLIRARKPPYSVDQMRTFDNIVSRPGKVDNP